MTDPLDSTPAGETPEIIAAAPQADTTTGPRLALYPESAAAKLGYLTLRQQLASYAQSEPGRETLNNWWPRADAAWIQTQLARVGEYLRLLEAAQAPSPTALPDVRPLLARLRIAGAWLLEPEWVKFFQWAVAWLDITRVLRPQQLSPDYPALAEWAHRAGALPEVLPSLQRMLGPEGLLRDSASTTLAHLRQSQRDEAGRLRRLMDRLLRQAAAQGWTDAPEPTLRGERLVLPIRTEFKHKMPGLIHDVSGTGQTVFIEPSEALPLNNQLRELARAEAEEVVRILTQMTDQLRPHLPQLLDAQRFLRSWDVLQARARLAQCLGGQQPELRPESRTLHLRQARHPLLLLQKPRNEVVPLDLRLSPELPVLLISGPNAGGKSVALKTVGLLQLMVQAGLLPPANEGSQFPVLGQILLSLGDDQSLADDLSTYTSHLQHMRHFCDELDDQSLFLIDEFGAGTDPMLGGPIARALLDSFVKRRAIGLVTTHYSHLKDFAAAHPKLQNGAMAFDAASLRPLYRLEVGRPGSSYALEIAARVGIPPHILAEARADIGQDRTDVEALLDSLQRQSRELQRENEQANRLRVKLQEEFQAQKQITQTLKEKRQLAVADARKQADRLVRDLNRRLEAAIREIQESKAEKTVTRQVRQQLAQEVPEVIRRLDALTAPAPAEPQSTPDTPDPNRPLAPGDAVRLPNGSVGELLTLQGKRAVVALGNLHTTVPLDELQRADDPTAQPHSNRARLLNPDTEPTQTQIDLRGQRVDEALMQVSQLMDDLIINGLPQAVILHGKGTGALRTAIREHIRRMYPQVRKLEDGPAEGGGNGLTIVWL
jgi:DNA mismatch repair protein MutS2